VVNFCFFVLNKLILSLFINLLLATPQPAKKYIKGRKNKNKKHKQKTIKN